MNNNARRASIYLGVFLAIVMLGGVFLPLLRNNSATTQEIPNPTSTPLPTFPPPPSDLTAIRFDQYYLHPSGIFAIAQPEGWTASEPNRGAAIAQVNLINNATLAVVDSYIEDPATTITADQLSDHFSESVINTSWANFTSWTESSRRLENERLTIDFTVTLQGRTYVARQEAWTDGDWIYVVRVLVPENATEMLRYLLENFVASLRPLTIFQGTPMNWSAHYDPNASHIIRFPQEWAVTDSAPGRPTSITSNDGILLRVEARAGAAVADEAAATAYVEGTRSGVTVTSVVPVERELGQGFSVAYGYTNVDGDQESGLAVLLNSGDTLHIANLIFPTGGVDLNTISAQVDTTSASSDALSPVLAQVMSTFNVIEPINLSLASLPATATPIPTSAPASETPEAEATVEATDAVEAEATAEATDAPADATPEATDAA